jgi:hypothetical protein
MEAMRQSWTDDRLDDLNQKVDQRFDEVDRRFEQVDQRFEQVDRRFEQVDRRFDEMDKRFDLADRETQRRFDEVDRRLVGIAGDVRGMSGRLDSLHSSVTYLAIGLTGGMLAGFAAICALIATQI